MLSPARVYLSLFLALLLLSCDESATPPTRTEVSDEQATVPVEDVLTEAEQQALTPTEIIRLFESGNERFVNNDLTKRNHSEQVRKTASAQFPKAIVLSCVDSRVPVEDVFDRGIGDIFVARVAGNFANQDIFGSMEYACKVAGSKLILVMGHEYCGAVTAAIKGVELGNITPMLANIQPAVAAVEYTGERTAENPEFLHLVCEQNVNRTIEQIRQGSPILREMEAAGEIAIAGAIYDMDTGVVSFMSE